MNDPFKIGLCIPAEFLGNMMDAIEETIGTDPDSHYSRAFSYWPIKGTWRSLEGAEPYNGRIGEITVADEMRLEFVVDGTDLEKTIVTIREHHPYEEPAIDIIPLIDWRRFIPSNDM